MREALYDRFMDDIACVDFRAQSGPGSRAGSKHAEAKRFLTAAQRCVGEGGGWVDGCGWVWQLSLSLSCLDRFPPAPTP